MIRIILFVLCALALRAHEALAQTNLATLDRGSAYEMTWQPVERQWLARIYVTLDAKAATPVTVALRAVAAGTRTDPALTGAFSTTPVEVEAPFAHFDIRASRNAALLPGTYQATLVLSAKETQQPVSIQLTVPAATLAGPATLELTRVEFSPSAEHDPQLQVWETSGRSYAVLRGQQTESFANSEGQVGGRLRIDPAEVTPSAATALPFELEGHFPPGAVTAKISVSSQQVAAPLVIPVTVRTRLSRWILAVLIVFGLGVGFFTRVIFKPRIEKGEAVRLAREADVALGKDEAKGDKTFQTAIATARAALRDTTQRESATVANISDAIKAAEAARQKALEDLAARLKTAEATVNEFRDVMMASWTLPATIANTLRSPREAATKAADSLVRSDADGAIRTVRAALEAWRADFVPQVGAWRKRVSAELRALKSVGPLIELNRREDGNKHGSDLVSQAAKAAETATPDAPLSELKKALEAIHLFTSTFPGFLAELAGDVRAGFQGMQDRLEGISLPDSNVWQDAHNAVFALATQLRAKIDATDTANWSNMDSDAGKALSMWRGAFEKQIQMIQARKPDLDVKPALDAFASGHYNTAAEELVKALGVGAAGKTQGDRDWESSSAARESGLPGVSAPWHFDSDGSIILGFHRFSRESARTPLALRHRHDIDKVESTDVQPEPFALFVATSMKSLLRAKIWQSSISWVALTVVGYLIFADKFVGTSGDLLSAFFWGFSTDIGIDGLLSAAKGRSGG